jgi:hypothetical protein
MVVTRSYNISGNILYLDGEACGWLRSVRGGEVFADVIDEPGAVVGRVVKKHLGRPRWEDLELQVDLSLRGEVYDWIAASWRQEYRPRTVLVCTVDPERNVIRRREFYRALITETTVSALDAASKDSGFLTLKILFQDAQTQPAGGRLPVPPTTRKRWLQNAFRLEIAGLDCKQVRKIDSFTVRQPFTMSDIGVLDPGLLSFPDLTVTLFGQSADVWQSWFKNFVLEGNNADSQEKSGRLTLLSPDQAQELARIDLSHVGIFRLAPEAGDDLPRQAVARLYCEQMDFKVT